MRKGEKMSLELKAKVSQGRKGKGLGNTNGFKKGVSLRKGVVLSPEIREKLRIAKLGKSTNRKGKTGIYSKETLEKMSKAKLGKKQSKETRDRNRQSQYKRHFKNNPDYIPDGWLDLRRKRIKESNSFHSQGEWETLKAQYNWTCPCCKKTELEVKLTRDHIIPISKGGSDNIENIQPLCHSCNSQKHTLTIKY